MHVTLLQKNDPVQKVWPANLALFIYICFGPGVFTDF